MYNIAVDPGSRNIGIAVFKAGDCILLKTLRVPAEIKEPFARYNWIRDNFEAFIQPYYEDGGIQAVAIEKFAAFTLAPVRPSTNNPFWKQTHYNRMMQMLVCSEARGVIGELAYRYAHEVKEVCKGSESKKIANLVAKSTGIKGSQDARDAFRIGDIAGFTRKR